MEFLKLWGICINSVFCVWLGHYITMRSRSNSVRGFGKPKPITKVGGTPPRDEKAVVPEWGDQ